MKFNTVLYKLQHSRNVGMIIRSHVALGGDRIIFVGYEQPWVFDSECISYATNLHTKCEILDFHLFDDFLIWSKLNILKNYAIEISDSAINLASYEFTSNCNFILGNEFQGIPDDLLRKCDANLIIPQYGPVACLSVVVAASITFYEFTKSNYPGQVNGSKYIGE